MQLKAFTNIKVDMTIRNTFGPWVYAMQGDCNSRWVGVTLLANGRPWRPSVGMEAAVMYRQPGGTKGLYNLLEDDTPAVRICGNRVEFLLAPQMLAVPGDVRAAIIINNSALDQLATFPFTVTVKENPLGCDQKAQDYIRLQWLESKLGEQMKKAKDSGLFDGAKGDPFTYDDFTPEQLAALTGPQGPQGSPGDSTAATAAAENARRQAEAAAGSAAQAVEVATQVEALGGEVVQLKENLDHFENAKIDKAFLYEINGQNEQISGTKKVDVSGNGEIAKIVADSVFRDNLIPIPDIAENTVNGLTYSAVDGIVSVSGTASTYTLIDLGVNLAMMDGINGIGYKIFIFDGTMPSGVSIVLGIATSGYTQMLTSTVQEKKSAGLVTFNGKNIAISVNNGTVVDFKFGVTVIPVNTIPSKFSNGCKYSGESLDELLCVSNMWAFGNDVSKTILNVTYRFKKSNLYGKSLFVAGDSVANGYGSGSISFGEIIANKNNMSLTKAAITGATFAKRDGLTNSILEQVESMDKDYDYVIVAGGFNDYFQKNNGVSIGTMPKNMNSSRDDKTTYGALDSICLWLKQNHPASKILFVVPHKIMTTAGVLDDAFYPYLQAIRDVCEKYSIPYADIALKGGCTPFYQGFRDLYFSVDGIHPNLEGYKNFYVPRIETEMEML